jgi:hypothetical protein
MRIKPLIAAVAVAGAGMLAVSACGSEVIPSIAQYAITTGHGNFSNQQVLSVASPGENVHLGSGTTTWYVWADTRNYVTAPANGDRNNPQAEITGPGASNAPGMSDYTWTYVTWELNPAIVNKSNGQYPVATDFLAFCLKYGCADTTPQNDDSNADLTRSVSAGWEGMLNEVMPRAIDNATRDAITSYGPSLWTERGDWDAYGTAISSHLLSEISQLDGSTTPFFCGPGSTTSNCTAPDVIVQNVTPSDPAVITAYNQQVAAQYAEQAGAARLQAAREIYGSDANYFLGVQDTINTCKAAGTTCNIYLGNPPVAP